MSNVFTGTATGPVVQAGDITGGLTLDSHTVRPRLLPDEGAVAEQRHQLYDLDADSAYTVPGATCPLCPPEQGSADAA